MHSPRYVFESEELTPEQARTLLWLAEGKTQRETAQILSLSYQAIERRLQRIKAKLGANTPTEALAICFARGFIKARI